MDLRGHGKHQIDINHHGSRLLELDPAWGTRLGPARGTRLGPARGTRPGFACRTRIGPTWSTKRCSTDRRYFLRLLWFVFVHSPDYHTDFLGLLDCQYRKYFELFLRRKAVPLSFCINRFLWRL
jgi:hypothetical protein